jgi:hypothetical protein
MAFGRRTAIVSQTKGWALTALALLFLLSRNSHAQLDTGSPLAPVEEALQVARFWDDQLRLTRSLGTDTTPSGLADARVQDSLRLYGARFRTLLDDRRRYLLSPADDSALAAMRAEAGSGLGLVPPTLSGAAPSSCAGSTSATGAGDLHAVTAAVMACYGAAANRIIVDGDTLNRLAILGRLSSTGNRARREAFFRALEPVWRSVNGDNSPGSPYRQLLALRRAAWGDTASPIERKGPAFGLETRTLEEWLTRALEAWRTASPDTILEPWDWYYEEGEAGRKLSAGIPRIADLRRVNDAFYRQLGADPVTLRIHYDLEARQTKYPVAFTDFGSRNRWRGKRLLPGEPWVFTSYLGGGLDNLAELLHESGHAIHIAAIRTRPAYTDWPDNDTFTEALADVPAMELYEPAWQQRFLGDSVPLAVSLRAKYSGVIFDLAWALFEIRVHREGGADPNEIWADITSRYLRIRPHPEWSWWAMRGQLIDAPGYLINYALGAFIVADARDAIRRQLGSTAWAGPEMYAWLSDRLYRFGLSRPSRLVLEDLLGRPLKPDALLADLARISP